MPQPQGPKDPLQPPPPGIPAEEPKSNTENTTLKPITDWFASKGGFTHVAAASIAGLFTIYYAVPPFQHLVQAAYLDTPPWAHNVVEAALGIYAFYKNPQKKEN